MSDLLMVSEKSDVPDSPGRFDWLNQESFLPSSSPWNCHPFGQERAGSAESSPHRMDDIDPDAEKALFQSEVKIDEMSQGFHGSADKTKEHEVCLMPSGGVG